MAVVYESEPPRSVGGEPGPFRRADYLALPDEPRCELLWGHLVVTPVPLALHQRVVLSLARRLDDFALAHRHRCLIAPMDVTLFDHTVLQPDLLIVARERRESAPTWIDGAPDLVVEVLSPSTGHLRSRRFAELAIDLDPLCDEVDRALTGRLPG